MIHKILRMILVILCVSACQAPISGSPNEKKEEIRATEQPVRGRQRADFNFLNKSIGYQEIVARVGEADRDVGFGLYIFEYDLADGSIICIVMSSLKSLDGASVIYADGRSEVIIGP